MGSERTLQEMRSDLDHPKPIADMHLSERAMFCLDKVERLRQKYMREYIRPSEGDFLFVLDQLETLSKEVIRLYSNGQVKSTQL